MDLPKLDVMDAQSINQEIKSIVDAKGFNDVAATCGNAIVEEEAVKEKVKKREEQLKDAMYDLAKAKYKVQKLSRASFLMKQLASRKIKKINYEAEIAMLLYPR